MPLPNLPTTNEKHFAWFKIKNQQESIYILICIKAEIQTKSLKHYYHTYALLQWRNLPLKMTVSEYIIMMLIGL